MKEFQKDHTTPEQSKRLLELGIPAESANCCYPETHLGERVKTANYVHVLGDGERILGDKAIPCWSALRLMEIIDICALGENSDPNTEEYPSTIKVMNKLHIPYVEYLVKSIERAVQLGIIDFSKLEIQ